MPAQPRPRHILFSFRNLGYIRFYESVIRRLAERGHSVHVLVDHGKGRRQETGNWDAMMGLVTRYPSVTFDWSPHPVGDRYVSLSHWIRRCLDYLHFLRPQFDAALILRERAASRAPRFLARLGTRPSRFRALTARVLETPLRWLEQATTSPMALEERIGQQTPDVIVVSPLIALGSSQFDVVRLARAAGIPTALAVASWDNLSAKVLISTIPDRIFVWNDIQRQEAVRYHRIPSEQVFVTGAQCFDEWFDRTPSQSRSDFCRRAGLSHERPFILYVCSALFEGSPSEAAFVERWVHAIRNSPDDRLRSTPILVRPHPKRGDDWVDIDLTRYDNVIVSPPRGQMPLGADGKTLYFDSLYHSAAVVGLNTSALIEAGIIGRPVYTVLMPEFYKNQEGTLHFHYLLQVEGGLLHAARSLDEHLKQVADGFDDQASAVARNGRFVTAFVRPRGLDVPATHVFADELERMTAIDTTKGVDRRPWWTPILRWLLLPVALAVRDAGRTAKASRRVPRRSLADSRLAPVIWRFRSVLRPLGRRWKLGELNKTRFWRALKLRIGERARAAESIREHAVKLRIRERRLRLQSSRRAQKRRRAARAKWRARVLHVAARLRGRRPPSR